MKKIILSLFLITSFAGILKAQETPPAGLKSVNAQFYINLSDSAIWHNKGTAPNGTVYGWERVARYAELITVSGNYKLKSDTVAATGYARNWKVTNLLAGKANVATTLAGYNITDAYTKTASDARFLGIAATAANSTLWGSQAISISGLGTNDILQYNGTAWQNVVNTYSSPLIHSGGNTSIQVANISQNGYLSAIDWATFNAKQSALVSGTNIKTVNSTTLLGSGNLAITTSNTDTTSTGFATRQLINNYATKNSPTFITPILGAASATSINLAIGTLTTPGAGVNINAGTSGFSGNGFAFRGPNGFTTTFDANSVTNGRALTIPDASGFIMTNPLNTAGDIIYLSANSTSGTNVARLGIGSNGYILGISSGLPSWRTPAQVLSDIGAQSTITFGTNVLSALAVNIGSANSLLLRDANLNLSVNNLIENYATTTTAAATTTLTVSSAFQQYFTGTTTQNVNLPVVSTLVLGQQFAVTNNSTGIVTVRSSGSNTIASLPAGSSGVFTCILTTGTNAASWNASIGYGAATGTANGYVTTTTQTFAGQKTFTGTVLANTFTSTLDITVNGVTIGKGAGTGGNNVVIGQSVFASNTTGSENTAQGQAAGYNNTTGTGNVYFGRLAGYANQTGTDNVLVGNGTGYNGGVSTSYTANTAIGNGALASMVTGAAANTAIGFSSGISMTTGQYNTFIGSSAGAGIVTGSNNIILGRNATVGDVSGYIILADGNFNNRLVIDNAGNSIFYGKLDATALNSTATQTTVSGSVSGSIIGSEPMQGSSYKKVVIYFNALFGTANYTFPVAFTNTPFVTGSSIAVSPSVTTTSASFTSAGAQTGWIIIEGY